MKRFIHLVMACLLVTIQTFTALQAAAHDTPAHQTEPGKGVHATTEQAAGVYEFITPRGRNLTLLVRWALQLYDQSHDDVVLSEPQTIYAETNIVKRLGSRQLAINEHVKIDEALLDEYAKNSKGLSPSQLAAWQQYAQRANFNLTDINPVRTSSARTDRPSPPQTDTQGNQDAGQDNQAGQSEVKPNNPDTRPRLRALWWAMGFLALWGLYTLLDRRNKKDAR